MTTSPRHLVSTLVRASKGGVISLPAAAQALGLSSPKATIQLRRLARLGWLQPLRRGLYLVRPLDAAPDHDAVPEDPWVLAREIFSPCYIGGWSAAEHWDLTEQLFASTLVVTGALARQTKVRIAGHSFRLFRIPRGRLRAGVISVWRGAERVDMSGLERTVIDGLRNPALLGGGRHLIQILKAYSEHNGHNYDRLLAIARTEASGAAWKRLGFLAENLWPAQSEVVDAARHRLTAGYSRLDPAIQKRGKLVKRWRLWINIATSELTEA